MKPMQLENILRADNIDTLITNYLAIIENFGASVSQLRGLRMLKALKRETVNNGPYPKVTLFEAANRIMTDLVILHGVAGLLKNPLFPYTEYMVEFGNEDNNDFDIQASSGTEALVGEAFNVSPSFFQAKKRLALKKLRHKGVHATHRIVMFNDDAVLPSYSPKPEDGLYHVFVSVESSSVLVKPDPLKNSLK